MLLGCREAARMSEAPGNVPASPSGVTITPAHREFFRSIPKVELHCHLFGAVRRETFIDLAKRARAPIEPAEIEAFYTRGDKPVGAIRVLRALDRHVITHAGDLHRMSELGLKIHPNTDDPPLHAIDPSGDWELMFTHFGFDLAALKGFMLNGIDGAWVDEAQKHAWREAWEAEFDGLEGALAADP
jgi:adenosine deaminase